MQLRVISELDISHVIFTTVPTSSLSSTRLQILTDRPASSLEWELPAAAPPRAYYCSTNLFIQVTVRRMELVVSGLGPLYT